MLDFTNALLNSGKKLRIHLIGVAGSGMSGLAQLLLEMGHEVSGSDRVNSTETERLSSIGLQFSSPHTEQCVDGCDYVIYSSAIRETNPARKAAMEQGIPTLRRAECLAAILHNKDGIIVAGTHGKTTTSALSAHVLRRANLNPSYYVGAEIPVLGTNAKWGDGPMMVAEGDESDGTLVLYKPKHSIILNLEPEHLDFYRDLDHLKEVFTTLINNTSGKVIYCAEDENATELVAPTGKGVSYGWENADYTASDLLEGRGVTYFTVSKGGEPIGRLELGIPGRHNVLNALAAFALADLHGADFTGIDTAMSSFAGAKRRFETKYYSPNYRIVDDYGHHPTEVEATLKTARTFEPERLVVAFQPHRYSRTQLLAKEFGEAFTHADLVYVSDIYAASEDPIEGVSAQTIVDAIKEAGGPKAEVVGPVAGAHHRIGNKLKPGDLLITLGAGNIHEVGTKIARDLTTLEDIQRFQPAPEDASSCLYEPMRRHTTIMIGGPAQFWIEPHTFAGFASIVNTLKERSLPIRIVGRGSNLLVRDGGIRGAVIHPAGGEFNEVRVEGNRIICGVGARFKKVASAAQAAGIGGFEWMEGIPGNVGGSLRMNAGAMGTETFDQVVEMTFLNEVGKIVKKNREEIVAHYRNVPMLDHNFALGVVFEGDPAPADDIQEKMLESRHKRNTSQPKAASAGCIFKNPLPDLGAGKLIDQLGLKGTAIGKAEISDVHANFFVNKGGATAEEMLDLIAHAQKTALDEREITLETEVQILGEDVAQF